MAGFQSQLWSVPVQAHACWASSSPLTWNLIHAHELEGCLHTEAPGWTEPLPPAVYLSEPLSHLMLPQTRLPALSYWSSPSPSSSPLSHLHLN